ncbi:MAG TPA: zinc-binding dehydrogenase [Acidimicrobiales bacterium]|nr:zinc-binding dehydrogenase [Acidimicrobiales bacterium]
MRAVVIADGAVTVDDRPDPVPGAGELLVKVAAAGLNGADLLQVAGFYPPPPGVPADIPGLELAGEVAAVGDGVTRFSVGDRVMAIVAGAGQAELALVHERVAMPVPDGLDWPAAGGFAETFTTAHDALFSQCGLTAGDRLLVNGAAGGVGVSGVQLGVAAGASVVASVRDTNLHARIADLGAVPVEPASVGEHGPYDVVLELVGAVNLADDLGNLATNGRVAVIGVGAGARGEIDLRLLMMSRGRIHGSTLRARPLEEKALAARRVEHGVLPLVRTGRITVPIEATFPLEEASAAYERMRTPGKLGKIVLTM